MNSGGDGGFKIYGLGVLMAVLLGVLMAVCWEGGQRLSACQREQHQARLEAGRLAAQVVELEREQQALEAQLARGPILPPDAPANSGLELPGWLAFFGQDPLAGAALLLCLFNAGLGGRVGWLLRAGLRRGAAN